MKVACFGAIAALFCSSCAMFGKAEPVPIRYFSPESALFSAGSEAAASGGLELRLTRVDGASHLDRRMVFQESDYDVHFSETRRWTQNPHEYLRVALVYELFQRRGMRRSRSTRAPTLEVRLDAFQLHRGDGKARVRMELLLFAGDSALLERTLTVEQDVADLDDGAVVAAALGAALGDAVVRSGDAVTQALEGRE